jgi:hypothetical protein
VEIAMLRGLAFFGVAFAWFARTRASMLTVSD